MGAAGHADRRHRLVSCPVPIVDAGPFRKPYRAHADATDLGRPGCLSHAADRRVDPSLRPQPHAQVYKGGIALGTAGLSRNGKPLHTRLSAESNNVSQIETPVLPRRCQLGRVIVVTL